MPPYISSALQSAALMRFVDKWQSTSRVAPVAAPHLKYTTLRLRALVVAACVFAPPSGAQQIGNVAGLSINSASGQDGYIASSSAGGGTGHLFIQMPEFNSEFRVYAGSQDVLQATGSNLSTFVPLVLAMPSPIADPFTPIIREINQLDGIVGQGPVALNILQTQESIDAPSVSVLDISDQFGGSTTMGVRTSLNINSELVATTGNSSFGGTEFSGELITMTASANDGGTAKSAAGAIWGVRHNVEVTGSATYWVGAVANETDIYLLSGTSATGKFGINIVEATADAVRGSRDDIGIAEASGSGVSAGWTKGFSFGTYGGYFPINSNGSMISAQGHAAGAFTVANGVDWKLGRFTGHSWDDGHIYFTGRGHIGSTGTKPELSNCGTGAELDSTASDLAGTITPSTESVFVSCTIIFAKPFSTPPHCGLTGWTATPPFIIAETTTQLIVHSGTNKFSYSGCTE